ncbi:hypothetical protein V6N13_050528 [Hibiscus sabdariffa]
MKLVSFVQLKNLRVLILYNTSLLIESDNRILTFPQLEALSLGSCNLTEFPEFIKKQVKLILLDLSNNHIHGVVPNWLWKSSLSFLDLSFNSIEFPNQLLLSDANFSSPNLRGLFLGSCNISTFPEFLRSLQHLKDLNLSNNKISGAIPNCFGNMSALESLDLHGNNFSGILPSFAKATQLRILKVSENRFEGKLPRSFVECTQLQILDVGNNMLHDMFPFWLERLPYLTVLILRENRFYGKLKHLKHKSVFPTLDVLDIASNQFSGELSIDFLQATQLSFSGALSVEFLQSLKAMAMIIDGNKAKPNYIGEQYYQDSVTIVNKGKCDKFDLPMPPPPGEDEEESWLDAMSIWKIALIGYASGLVVGICIGNTVLNELENKWVYKFKYYGKRNRRRSR